jgi:hypothetical protein
MITLNIAAKLTLIILFSTVKSKSWVFKNMFSNASNIFLHKLYFRSGTIFVYCKYLSEKINCLSMLENEKGKGERKLN